MAFADREAEWWQQFKEFDRNGDGRISVDELGLFLSYFNSHRTNKNINKKNKHIQIARVEARLKIVA